MEEEPSEIDPFAINFVVQQKEEKFSGRSLLAKELMKTVLANAGHIPWRREKKAGSPQLVADDAISLSLGAVSVLMELQPPGMPPRTDLWRLQFKVDPPFNRGPVKDSLDCIMAVQANAAFAIADLKFVEAVEVCLPIGMSMNHWKGTRVPVTVEDSSARELALRPARMEWKRKAARRNEWAQRNGLLGQYVGPDAQSPKAPPGSGDPPLMDTYTRRQAAKNPTK